MFYTKKSKVKLYKRIKQYQRLCDVVLRLLKTSGFYDHLLEISDPCMVTEDGMEFKARFRIQYKDNNEPDNYNMTVSIDDSLDFLYMFFCENGSEWVILEREYKLIKDVDTLFEEIDKYIIKRYLNE